MSNKKSIRHLLGISGGKDSAALAIYMKDKVPETDTFLQIPELTYLKH
jgi:tRNA(Ile)-lysidine synthase TilS/MesJ